MIERLVVLGGTGDLTARYLLPGLAALRGGEYIGDGFRLVSVGRKDLEDEEFGRWASARLEQHAPHIPSADRRAIVASAEYHCADVTDPAALAAIVSGTAPVAAYLALPPSMFAPTISALHAAGLAPGSSIVVEKPFG